MKFSLKQMAVKPWATSGLLGVSICLALYAFFYFAFSISGNAVNPGLLRFSLITGHGIVLLWGFVYPYGSFCPKSLHYNGWSAEPVAGGVACNSLEGPGYCFDPSMRPDDACADMSGLISFVVVSIAHVMLYFGAGALLSILFVKLAKKK